MSTTDQPPDPGAIDVARLVDDLRIAAAHRLLPGSGGSGPLDRLCELAARLLDVPSAQLSLLTDVQHVVAGHGLAAGRVGTTGPMIESLCTVTAASGRPLIVSDAVRDARVAGLPPVRSGAVGAYLGAPLLTAERRTIGSLCVFGPELRPWTEFEVSVVERLAASAVSELELAALSADYEFSRLRWDVAIEAAGIGSFEVDLRTGRTIRDDRLRALWGFGDDEGGPDLEGAFDRVHPDDQPALRAAVAAAIASGGDYRAEFRIPLPGGGERWLASRGRAETAGDGTVVRLAGAAYDITETRTAADRAAQLIESMTAGFLTVDRDWRVEYLNATGERVLGLTSAEVLGRSFWQVFPDTEDLEFAHQYHRAMDTGESVEFDAYYPHLDAWFEVRAVPGPNGLTLYFLDITARRNEQLRADAASSRLALVAEVTAAMSTTLDGEAAVARLAELVVPVLADWAIVSLPEADGLRDIGFSHADPALVAVVERYAATRTDRASHPASGELARARRQPVFLDCAGIEAATADLRSADAVEALAVLAPTSAVVLPMVLRERVVGVLTLCRGKDRDPMGGDDLAVASEIAARAALALDNARLYTEQRSLAEGLQRSLLTAPPEPDHVHISVRYVAAAEVASVGGDWFDSFLQPDGSTVLVVGDVMGHDTEAAAAMGQLRGVLRGIAWHSGAGPAAVLEGLDAAIEGLNMATAATAVVARVEQSAEQDQRRVRGLRWSNAGHPPPMVIDVHGLVGTLAAPDVDLLLGVDATSERHEHVVELEEGATIVFYTDGLVERRGQSLDDGLDLLRSTLGQLSDLPLEAMCDELLGRLLTDHPDDDVALVALRLHRQDRPRPAEAGPQHDSPGSS